MTRARAHRPNIRPVIDGDEYPAHIQRQYEIYMAELARRDALRWHDDLCIEQRQQRSTWHNVAVVLLGGLVVAMILFAWLSI